ncbi:hypothetical protein FRC04_003644 [Tulasnella sp. 424]|nr:hypothetical protein FRC04_003644 [Tulasnella sp. 424]KAG8965511.1 hypothetical protein FRC05_003244 [Tulasnella sp. 425]
MRSFITFISLFSLAATSVFASPVVPRDPPCGSEICKGPDPSDYTPNTPTKSISERAIDASTNAERFARGLPPKKPKLIAGSPVRRDSQPSSLPPVTRAGIIEVHNAANDALLGYISKNLVNGGAQFGYDPAIANALLVSFQTPAGATGTVPTMDITAVNSNPSWPLLGLVQGRDDTSSDIAAGSYQYLYLGGISNPGTQPNDPPTLITNSYFIGAPRTAESAVWSFNTADNTLSLQWVNTDSSKPTMNVWTQSTGLYAGGDQGAFFSRYPAPVTAVTYKFVPQ